MTQKYFKPSPDSSMLIRSAGEVLDPPKGLPSLHKKIMAGIQNEGFDPSIQKELLKLAKTFAPRQGG